MEKIEFSGFQDCVRLTNGEIEIVAATGFGPRILAYNFVGGANVLGIHHAAKVETALGEFRPYGGHRLWIAPENMPNSYAPDNAPVEFEFDEQHNSIRLIQPLEPITETQKEITVTLERGGSGVKLVHKITNRGAREIELAAWALTIMRGGGEVLIPNEPFAPYGADTLLPVRNLTVWAYTDLSDARWRFDENFIRLRVDAEKSAPQKIGVLCRQNQVRYRLADVVFTKKFEFAANAVYPDMNSNVEVYTAADFIEIETLAPLVRLPAQAATEHVEHWRLAETAAEN